jgi:hypothetical protein
VVRAAFPYVLCDLVAVGILMVVPAIGTFLPSLMQR